MDAHKNPRTFFFEDLPVGYFVDDPLPSSAGCYRYVPYRGPGHYQLGLALRTFGPQRCHYIAENFKRRFSVLACPVYGLLELADFDDPHTT